MITPMVTPLTFEALVDELFHIDNGNAVGTSGTDRRRRVGAT